GAPGGEYSHSALDGESARGLGTACGLGRRRGYNGLSGPVGDLVSRSLKPRFAVCRSIASSPGKTQIGPSPRYLGQREVQPTQMGPGTVVGKLRDGLAKGRARLFGPAEKQGRHTPVKEH